MTTGNETFVLDTSAILALWNNEEGADTVEKILREAKGQQPVLVSFMTFMECRYRIWKDQGQQTADEMLRSLRLLPVEQVDVTEAILATASELKASYRISVADSWIIATAINRSAVLVHKDPEFEALSDRVVLKTLPYKKTK
ncbi:MAG: PIN domain-containing protein [Deltaproteobacteria bacterium]|nr:PIN domain-containing protein [Deltaproteobacteria bacterium]MBW1926024.1 PIN domain-containing protein [Deltaproteobacteria bacterium]MBW1966025.1 PIN domain-containing protein [Deltaproteobacteria bacterium]MBW2097456.1 PIN domain-containing protein [Deltaproteobacteria bacterium]